MTLQRAAGSRPGWRYGVNQLSAHVSQASAPAAAAGELVFLVSFVARPPGAAGGMLAGDAPTAGLAPAALEGPDMTAIQKLAGRPR